MTTSQNRTIDLPDLEVERCPTCDGRIAKTYDINTDLIMRRMIDEDWNYCADCRNGTLGFSPFLAAKVGPRDDGGKVSPDLCLRQFQGFFASLDTQSATSRSVELMCDILKQHGYGEAVEFFDVQPKSF